MFTGPVGPVKVFFYWLEALFGNFYWPGAIGQLLTSSPVQKLEYHSSSPFLVPGEITD